MNVIFDLIQTLSGSLNGVKKEELVKNNQFSALVTTNVEKSNFYKDLNSILDIEFNTKKIQEKKK